MSGAVGWHVDLERGFSARAPAPNAGLLKTGASLRHHMIRMRKISPRTSVRNGFHFFVVNEEAPQFGAEVLRKVEEAEDQAYLSKSFQRFADPPNP
jgi:hypothetical protein